MASSTLVHRPNGNGTVTTYTEEQMELIKRQICRPKRRQATDDELALFRYQCERTGLDPFSRQIYAIFRWNGSSEQEEMGIQAAIDGLRLIAERTGKYAGQEVPLWCDEDGSWVEVWFQKKPPKAAKVVVNKVAGGKLVPTPAVAHYDEYVPKKGGKALGLWPSKPALMLAKCAEALALRKAFPAETSGLYIPEETEHELIVEAEPEPAAGELVEGGSVIPGQSLDPERIEKIVGGFAAMKLRYSDIGLLLGAAGIDGLRAHSKKAVEERLATLTPEQADALDAEMERGAAR